MTRQDQFSGETRERWEENETTPSSCSTPFLIFIAAILGYIVIGSIRNSGKK